MTRTELKLCAWLGVAVAAGYVVWWLDLPPLTRRLLALGGAMGYAFYLLVQKLDRVTRRPAYVCRFELAIIDDAEPLLPVAHLRGPGDITLPFPPYPGLVVDTFVKQDDDNGVHFLSEKIETVMWDGDHFRCIVANRKLYPGNTVEGVVGIYEHWGWRRHGYAEGAA